MKTSKVIKSLMMGIALLSAPVIAQDSASATPGIEVEKIGYWDDIIYGSPDAPIEIVEYASLTCSHCGHFALDVFPKLKEKYIDTGKVRLRFRNFILNQFDFALAVVSRCKDEDLARKLTHAFLSKQSAWLGKDNPIVILEALAAMEGLPLDGFTTCLENKALAAHLGDKREEWTKSENIQHTPTIKIDGIELAPPTWVKLDTAIEMKLSTLK